MADPPDEDRVRSNAPVTVKLEAAAESMLIAPVESTAIPPVPESISTPPVPLPATPLILTASTPVPVEDSTRLESVVPVTEIVRSSAALREPTVIVAAAPEVMLTAVSFVVLPSAMVRAPAVPILMFCATASLPRLIVPADELIARAPEASRSRVPVMPQADPAPAVRLMAPPALTAMAPEVAPASMSIPPAAFEA